MTKYPSARDDHDARSRFAESDDADLTMTYEPSTLKEAMDARVRWCEEKLPSFVPTIEKLTSDAVFNASGKRLSFQLNYCVDKQTKHPKASLSGSFNICIFLSAASHDNPSKQHNVCFRIPFPDRTHASEAYRNEAATLSYLHRHTSIPVPRLYTYAYSTKMKMPYMVLSSIKGKTLSSVASSWETIPGDRLSYLFEQLGDIVNQLMGLKFNRIGSLRSMGKVPGTRYEYNIDVAGRPTSLYMEDAMTYGRCTFDQVLPIKTTFNSARAYCDALTELHWKVFEDQDHLVHKTYDIRGDGAVLEEFNVRKALQDSAVGFLERNTTASDIFRLQHPDFRAGNIFIDPKTFKITGIIDWEHAIVLPLSMYRLPTFASIWQDPQTEATWYKKTTKIWDSLLEHVDNIGDFDIRRYFQSRTSTDYFIGQALQDLDALLKIVEQTQLFPDSNQRSMEDLTTDDKDFVTSKIMAVREYDRKLRSRYDLNQLQTLYKNIAQHSHLICRTRMRQTKVLMRTKGICTV